ncbi:DNA primase, partial [Escherichia coli]|nr:DNA primase [Escherichia coli]
MTAVLTNYGEKEYAPGKGRCFFVELTNRSGKREYWGKGLEELVKNHQKGDPVTLTLQARERSPSSQGKPEWVRNIWTMKPVCNGISVSHDNPHEGQYIREYPAATFRQMMTLLQQGWPQLMQDVRLPDKVPDTLYLGEDRQPAAAPRDPALRVPLNGTPPATLTPLIFSVDKQSQRLDLLLLQSADEYM